MTELAFRMLLHDRAKLAITLAGVAFAVTLVIVQVGLFRGLLANATVAIEHADADLWITSRNTPNVDFPHYFADSAVQRVRSVPGVVRADNLMVVFVGMQLPSGAEETIVLYGIDDSKRWNVPWHTLEGDLDDLRRGRGMMLDDSAMRRLGAFAVGERREVFGRRLEIVGRTKDAISFTTMPMAFTSFRAAQDLEPHLFSGRTAYALVKLAAGADANAIAREIRERLPHNDVYTREAWARRTRDYWVVSTGLGMNIAFTVVLGVLVGVTVVAQTLYASTLDHVRELGTLKAMGATTPAVCGLVATQAVIAGVIGYALAVPCIFVARALAGVIGLSVRLSADVAVLVLVGALALCLAASLLTFRRIASIDPALVFRA